MDLSHGQLYWLADLRGLERRVQREQLRNYRYRLIARRAGGLPRLLEIPKGRLKEIQRWILREILDRVPPHGAAHGFRAGRSVRSHAEPHCRQEMVLTLDLTDFFTAIRLARVAAIFAALGYRAAVARLLAGLCTNIVPLEVWSVIEASASSAEAAEGRRFRWGRMLASPHLPQGAPTSPALANLAALGLDRRLSGLSASHGLVYSRYADDMTFSGQRLDPRARRWFVAMAAEIIRAEGFLTNVGKTRWHPNGGRQVVCGVVVNVRPNMAARNMIGLPRRSTMRFATRLTARIALARWTSRPTYAAGSPGSRSSIPAEARLSWRSSSRSIGRPGPASDLQTKLA